MTAPTDFRFLDESGDVAPSLDADLATLEGLGSPVRDAVAGDDKPRLPPPIIDISEDQMSRFKIWLDQRILVLESQHAEKQNEWASFEEAYRARPGGFKTEPFEGADATVIPVIAMAVDPVVARLFTGIFQQDPVFFLKALKKSFVPMQESLNNWVDYYQKHKLKLAEIAAPRLFEFAKLGTMAFKTVYDEEKFPVKTYDENWNVVDREMTIFRGPRVFGVELGNLLFDPRYQHVQDCPIVGERFRSSWWDLKVAEASGKITNVDDLLGQDVSTRTPLESERQDQEKHREIPSRADIRDGLIEYFEFWFDYDINDDNLPERMVATYHFRTRTVMSLRFNWYFHQRKPYTVIPYMVSNETLYGLGLCEAVLPFQDSITKWNQMATDNAYIANIRMFISKKDSGIEEVPRLYTGRVFFVDDPRTDFIPFAAGDIYPSTLLERQNLFGLVEKRTGVSDYLTGRESPIIGSRATATSTLALIEQGTKRVEQTLENVRRGFSEIIENCFYIWMQYGLDGLDDLVFGDDQIGDDLRKFFGSVTAENVNGAIAIDLATADAGSSRQVMQQMQLQIIQVMMQYLEKVLQAGAEAMGAQQQGMPEFAGMVGEVMTAARKMFKDLLQKYDIRNPDEYLPDLEKFLNANTQGQGANGGPQDLLAGAGGAPGLPGGPAQAAGPVVPRPAQPGEGPSF